MSTTELIDNFNNSLIENFNLIYSANTRLDPTPQEISYLNTMRSKIDNSIFNFYSKVGKYKLDWQNTLGLPQDVRGSVNFISVLDALSDWKGIVYFDDDSPLKHFRIVDQFINEACCGFYTTESKTGSASLIYFYDYSDDPVSLQLTIEEYIIMMTEARGFLYWQKVLVDHLRKEESAHTKLMKEELGKVFIDYSFDAFISKFEELRKSKPA